MPGKLLIANRGEIAIRIARTATALGWTCIMVHSEDDANMLHTRFGDEVAALPGQGPRAYLDIDAVITAARETGADTVHPGYGLLSENADFARAIRSQGLRFVGPMPGTLEQLGDKVQARQIAQDLGVPVIEGTGPLNHSSQARDVFATLSGGAMMLKAAAGGGGRGMRIVSDIGEIEDKFALCQAEATNAFGDPTLLAERYLRRARHVEVQIAGDGKTVIALGDRDCSLQRRHQKLLEIAPAPQLSPETRRAIHDAACRIGNATNYLGLGTVEFLLELNAQENGAFYFIEANPRLQVEHTITEEVTGLDLVELQLLIAGGATLASVGLTETPASRGTALQARISTERIAKDGEVRSASGTLSQHNMPGGPGIRVDGHGHVGYRPNPRFDPLLAKLIVSIPTANLHQLLNKTHQALGEMTLEGCDTNKGFLSRLVSRQEVQEWQVTTTSLSEWLPVLADQDTISEGIDDTSPDGGIYLHAPMQAALVKLHVEPGDRVAAGAELAIFEALKMQHGLPAPQSGLISEIFAEPGDVLNEGDRLFAFTPADTADAVEHVSTLPDPDHIRGDLERLMSRQALTEDAHRPKAVERRRTRQQNTTRENIDAICQDGAFEEYGQLVIAGQRRENGREKTRLASPADGIVTGIGTVNGDLFAAPRNQVALLAYDSTVMAGTQGMFGHMKTDRLLELAETHHLASIFFTEGGGGRPNDTDFADVLHSGLGVKTFSAFAALKGWGPKITVNSGYCFAGNAAIFGAGDIRIATRNSWIGLGGPAMIEAGGLGRFSPKEIGPAAMHAKTGGLDILVESDSDAAVIARQTLAIFQGDIPAGPAPEQKMLRHLVPEDRKRAYAMRDVISTLADTDSFIELGSGYSPGLITGLCRVEGKSIALMANNPMHLGGALDAPASAKGARFLKLCQRFSLPVLSLCDTPGFMVGPDSEEQGAVTAACDFIAAGAALTRPLMFVCLRKGYGIGAQAMAGGSFANPAFAIAWPSGEFGAMGLEGAVRLGRRRELEAEPDPVAREALFERHVAHAYREGGALNMASLFEIDAVIDPGETRNWIRRGLNLTRSTG